MAMILCHIAWYLPLQLGVTCVHVGSGSGGGDVIRSCGGSGSGGGDVIRSCGGSGSGGGDVIRSCGGSGVVRSCVSPGTYMGFLLTRFCCAFLSVVLSEEQKQNVTMFVDPVNKFFQVWCACVCV